MLRARFLHLNYNMPGPGIESRSPACKAGVLTTTPPRLSDVFHRIHLTFKGCNNLHKTGVQPGMGDMKSKIKNRLFPISGQSP